MPEHHSEDQPTRKQISSMSIDLNLFPLSRQISQDQPGIPGLYMVTPPRKTARGRERDRLILFFTLTGNAPLTGEQQEQLLGRLAQTYYKVPGAITSAQRKLADTLNQHLLERNLRSSSSGRQGIGIFQVVVLRDDLITIGHCGPTHAFLIKPEEVQHLSDPQTSGRGLGLTRSVSIRFFQFTLQNNDLIILTAQPPATWTPAALQNAHKQGIESLRRKLISQAGNDLNAVLIQALRGSGKVRMMRLKPPSPMVQPSTDSGLPTSPPPAQAPIPEAETSPEETAELTSPAESVFPEELVEAEPELAPVETGETSPPEQGPFFPLHYQLPDDAQPETDSQEPAIEEQNQQPTPAVELAEAPTNVATAEDAGHTAEVERKSVHSEAAIPAGPAKIRWLGGKKSPTESHGLEKSTLAGAGRHKSIFSLPRRALAAVAAFILLVWQRISNAFRALLRHILPDENLFTIPASTMLFVAVAVGVVIATTGGMMYFQRGRSIQYQNYYDQALSASQQATSQSDPLEIRADWEITLHFINQAENFLVTPETISLRAQARQTLDDMDAIQRVNYRAALLGELSTTARITRMFATDTDLYMLDSSNGSVIRAYLTGRGYDLDNDFSCSSPANFGPIIDISPLPKGNNLKATVLAMDANANLLYCIPGKLPVTASPVPPQINWREPNGFTYDGGDLYMLDPAANAVWIYRGIEVDREPRLFFGSQIPFMPDVIDLAVNRNDLYLLHADGHLTTCTYSNLQESPTRCQDPANYSDSRVGRQSGPIINDAPFNQILYTSPPDPSIYMLNPVNLAIYHFSLRLTFQRQFRPQSDLGQVEATAFTISPNRTIFIATGHRVYYADLP